jgi:hypothetical protein
MLMAAGWASAGGAPFGFSSLLFPVPFPSASGRAFLGIPGFSWVSQQGGCQVAVVLRVQIMMVQLNESGRSDGERFWLCGSIEREERQTAEADGRWKGKAGRSSLQLLFFSFPSSLPLQLQEGRFQASLGFPGFPNKAVFT